MTAIGQLLKCTVEEFAYLRGSQWLTVTDEEKKIFEVAVDQPNANNGVLKVEVSNASVLQYKNRIE